MQKAMSALQIGSNNSQSGTMWICNLTTKENKKVLKGNIPDGWIAGRNVWKTPKLKKQKQSKEIQKQSKEKKVKKYLHGYSVSVEGIVYESISHAADCLGIGHETARMRFKSKSFPEYIILSR